ncbi:hypothetical protein GCM10010435_94360 [Winogradskya consettensis]|uniref:N-acetyltransferase domain-containing protein n=1 Tax=Winogradskya consettensis TaxID=113560 RepID=A0A919W1S9_9ACTN|nr:GNAT family N-acetyltransferase [Actinoplanes consettensis]GIM84137.1 hypothetical protein Aco04nite_89910 [Actinoplanes consettensis]
MLIESRAFPDPELAALLLSQQQELGQVENNRDDIAYLVVVVRGRVVACGGWQAMEPGAAVLRRIFVRPAFRGRGIAGQLVVALEEEALAVDRPLLRMEGCVHHPAMIALYRSAGYSQTATYGERIWFEKSLLAHVGYR